MLTSRLAILINNHSHSNSMDIKNKLNNELLKQAFAEEQLQPGKVDECRLIASTYARIENSIAVLSDMKANTSYIY